MKKRLLLASLSAAAFGGILSVNAADMPVYTLDQVVVTAARTEEKQIDTNASVSVVTSKQIAQKHFNDVSEALRAVPGVVLGNYSASGQNYSSNKVFYQRFFQCGYPRRRYEEKSKRRFRFGCQSRHTYRYGVH